MWTRRDIDVCPWVSHKVCTNLAVLKVDGCIHKCHLFGWPSGSKLDEGMVTVKAHNVML